MLTGNKYQVGARAQAALPRTDFNDNPIVEKYLFIALEIDLLSRAVVMDNCRRCDNSKLLAYMYAEKYATLARINDWSSFRQPKEVRRQFDGLEIIVINKDQF